MERKNVFENVAMPLRTHYTQCKFHAKLFNKEYMSEKEIAQKVNSLLEIVGLDHKNKSYPRELSGGKNNALLLLEP